MNERIRILKLLEEGKINAEEAARLLEALSEGGSRKKFKAKIWNSLEGIPNIIATAIDTSMKFTDTEEILKYPKKKKLEFKGISGDLVINGKDDYDDITIQKDGFVKVKEDNDIMNIKALSGDITITTPPSIDLSLKGISGDLKMDHINGIIAIETVSGDIVGSDLSGSLFGDIVSGDVDFEFTAVKKVQLRSRSGNVTLWLEDTINADLNIHTEKGTISCDFDLKDAQRTKKTLKGTIKKHGAIIDINNKSGDVVLKKRSHKSR